MHGLKESDLQYAEAIPTEARFSYDSPKFEEPMLVSPWAHKADAYRPTETSETHLRTDSKPQPEWADSHDLPSLDPSRLRKRMTFEGPIDFDESDGRPLNPRGRTGMTGRGKLERWGPNLTVELLLTRDHPVRPGAPCPPIQE
jgi:hypothetical protein